MLKINPYNTQNIAYCGKTRDILLAKKYASTRLISPTMPTETAVEKPVRKKHKIKSYVSYFKRQLINNKKAGGE